MNPDEFTLAELCIMAESKGRYDWQIASAQMALIINMFSAKGRKVKPDELNPYVRKQRVMVPLEFLKEIFCNNTQVCSLTHA